VDAAFMPLELLLPHSSWPQPCDSFRNRTQATPAPSAPRSGCTGASWNAMKTPDPVRS